MTARQNPFAYPKPITLDSLEDLFAHHRDRFGGWHMEGDGGDGGASADTGGDGKARDDKGKGDAGGDYKAPASQADLDRIISDRLAREREKVAAQYADYSDLKKKAAAHDAKLAEAMTDAEKAVAAARKEGETAAQERTNTRLVKAEARALAAAENFRDPTDAVAFLDLSSVSVNDEGEVDAAALKTQLKTLAETKTYLVDDGKKPAPRADHSQGGSGEGKGSKLSGLGGSELYDRLHPKKTA